MNDTMQEVRKSRTAEECFESLRQCAMISASDGNWNANPYMHGMCNGLILAVHIMADDKGECPYLDRPDQYLDELPHWKNTWIDEPDHDKTQLPTTSEKSPNEE